MLDASMVPQWARETVSDRIAREAGPLVVVLLMGFALAGCTHAPATRLGWSGAEIEAARRCEADDVRACGDLGSRLVEHKDSAGDVERGMVLLETACGQDDAAACTALAQAYLQGSRGDRSTARAAALAGSACQKGHGPACTVAGEVALERDEGFARAAEHFGRGCERGDARGCEMLGLAARQSEGQGALSEKGFTAGCALGRLSSCHRLALQLLDEPARRDDGLRRLMLTCEGGYATSCAVLSLLGAPLVSASPTCPKARPFADRACRGGDAVGCAVVDACRLTEPREHDAALETLRQACGRRVSLACLYWADAIDRREDVAEGDDLEGKVLAAYADACRDQSKLPPQASKLACARVVALKLARVSDQDEAAGLLTRLRGACETQRVADACCALSAAYRRGRWVPAEPDKAKELETRACEIGPARCCPPP